MGGKKRPRGWRVKNNTPKISAVTKWGFRKDRSMSKERIKFGFTRIEDSWREKEDTWRRMIDSCDSGSRNILYARNFLHSALILILIFLQNKREEKENRKKGEDSKRICSSLEDSLNTLRHKILEKSDKKTQATASKVRNLLSLLVSEQQRGKEREREGDEQTEYARHTAIHTSRGKRWGSIHRNDSCRRWRRE